MPKINPRGEAERHARYVALLIVNRYNERPELTAAPKDPTDDYAHVPTDTAAGAAFIVDYQGQKCFVTVVPADSDHVELLVPNSKLSERLFGDLE